MTFQLKINKLDGGYIGEDDESYHERFECQHMSTARDRAIQAAKTVGVPIAIEKVTPPRGGREGFDRGAAVPERRTVLIINEDGSPRPPEGTKAPGPFANCKKGPGRPPCFCENCRAERRA